MKSTLRRYEVLLPVRFNDGTDVPAETLAEDARPGFRTEGARQASPGQASEASAALGRECYLYLAR
jgi:hypothetical protein